MNSTGSPRTGGKTTAFRRSPFAIAMLMFSSLPPHALAQESAAAPPPAATAAPSGEAPVTQLQQVEVRATTEHDNYNPAVSTVGGKGPTAVRDIPQQVTVIDKSVMEAQGATSIQDALRYVPGITFTAAEGGTIGNNINLRGFSARTDIYLDSFRDRGQYYRDVFSLDSIEVLVGPSSMMFGRGSTGGVINQVSKVPTRTPHDELEAQFGTSDQYRATGDFDHTLSPDAAFRVAAMAQTLHSTRDVMHNQDYGLAPSLSLKLNDKVDLTLTGLAEYNHDMPDYGLPPVNGAPADVARANFYGLTDDATTQAVKVIGARLKYQILPELSLRQNLQYSRYSIGAHETGAASIGYISAGGDMECPTVAAGAFCPLNATDKSNGNHTDKPLDELLVQLGSHARDIRDSSAFSQTDVLWKFNSGPIAHDLIAGAEVGRDSYDNTTITLAHLPVVSLIDPEYGSRSDFGVTSSQTAVSSSSAITEAAYVNDTVTLTPQWKLVGGVRWDRFDAQVSNVSLVAGTPPRGIPQAEQTVYYDSVRGGVLYQPDTVQTYYASYGTSFDPSLEQLTGTAGQQALPPEKNRSYEVGGKWDLMSGNLSLNSALFQVEKTNARSQVDTGVYELDGDVRVNGFAFNAAGRITKNWEIFSGYTWLDAKVVSASSIDLTDGKTPSNVPRNNATLWTTYKPFHAWETGTGLVYTSSRYVTANDSVQVDGYVRWDATVAFHQKQYDLRLNLQNLTDKRYYDSVIQSDGGRSVPGITRSALFTVTYRM
jgi:catecholate siderophore receptor